MEKEARVCGSYTSDQRILVVGDGDFSFCLSLCKQLRSGHNVIATSYDAYDVLVKKYVDAAHNTEQIASLGSVVLHGVDATNLQETLTLPSVCATTGLDATACFAFQLCEKFDRVVFQFPLVYAMLDKQSFQADPDPCIRNRRLIRHFLHSAYHLLRDAQSEIHISSKETRPYLEWNIEALALGLLVDEVVSQKQVEVEDGGNCLADGGNCLADGVASNGERKPQPDAFGFLRKYPFEREAFPDYKSRNVMHTDGFPLTDAFTYVYGFAAPDKPLYCLDFIYDTKYYIHNCVLCRKKFSNDLDNNKHYVSQDHKRAARLASLWDTERGKIDSMWRERRRKTGHELRNSSQERADEKNVMCLSGVREKGNFYNEPSTNTNPPESNPEANAAKRKREED
jgi:25S rRNA (uracil2634-N3)-methyltransferase